jgi:hypothetical protein
MDTTLPVIKGSGNYTSVGAADFKNLFVFTATGSFILPTAASVGGRFMCSVYNASTIPSPFAVEIYRSSGSSDTIDSDNVIAVIVPPGCTVDIFSDGVSKWYTRGRQRQIVLYGNVTLPASGTSTAGATATFASAFPNALQGVVCTPTGPANSSAGGSPIVTARSESTSGFFCVGDTLGFTTFNQTVLCNYIAWGY